jgi:hypothetical protein
MDWKTLRAHGLYNAYIDDHSSMYKYEDCLHLLFEIGDNFPIKESLTKHVRYVDSYVPSIRTDKLMEVFVYDIAEYRQIIEYFLNGEYSKFPKSFVKEIYGTHGKRVKICNKDIELLRNLVSAIYLPKDTERGMEELKDREVWSSPLLENEIINYNLNLLKK